MSALPLTITAAGLAALINANNTGASAMVIDAMGFSPTAIVPTAATTAIPDEVKRIEGVAGQVVADDTLHVSVFDQSSDTYTVRTVGLYLDDGTLFGLYSQPGVIVEKASPSMTLLDADVRLSAPMAENIEFTGGGWTNPPASETVVGVLRLATAAEAEAGVNHSRAITPATLKAVLDARFGAGSASAFVRDLLTAASAAAMRLALGLKGAALKDEGAGNGLDADLLDGQHGAYYRAWGSLTGVPSAISYKDAGELLTGRKIFKANVAGGFAGLSYSQAPMEVQAVAAGSAAVMSFHIPGVDALTFGLAEDSTWRVQHGGAGRLIWHSGNFDPVSKASAVHGHAIADVGGLQTALDAKAPLAGAAFSGVVSAPSFQASAPAGYGSVHMASGWAGGVPGGLSFKDGEGAEVGYLGWTATYGGDTCLVLGGVRRWAFPQRPRFGDHLPWDAGNFDPATKAAAVHGHAIADVDGLTAALAGKSAVGHGHTIADVDGLAAALAGKSAVGHGHAIADVDGLTAALAGKSALVHGHAIADVDGLTAALAGKSAVGHTHVSAEITDLLDTVWPAGELKLFDLDDPPAGARVLIAEGQEVSRTTYARLFAAIGVRYGAGDEATTFNLPDWRGVFFRGLDRSRGLDPGRALGFFQDSQNRAHSHSIPARSSTGSNNGYVEDGDSDGTVRTTYTGSDGGAEARPVNQALLACITY